MPPPSDALPLRPPLSIGETMPSRHLSAAGVTISPDDLRGQTTVLLFTSSEWNPAHAEQMTQFYNALVRAATDTVVSESDSLSAIQSTGMHCSLRFEGSEDTVDIRVLPNIDTRSASARDYGVFDRQAIFVVDAAGIVRFRYLTESASPGIGPLVDALRGLHPPGDRTRPKPEWRATRRDFIAAALAGAFALTLGPSTPAEAEITTQASAGASETIPVKLRINGNNHSLNLDPRVTLLDALRENLGLTGSKKGCDHGQCGACTVHIDGQRSLSCLALAAQQEGSEIVTIEGLAKGEMLHPVQQAFLDHDGYQCGYCTPGQIMSAVALLREGHARTDSEIREGMSGNLCRCAAYPHIIEAVRSARDSGKRV